MSYTLDRTLNWMGFDDAVARTKGALSKRCFGVLTETRSGRISYRL